MPDETIPRSSSAPVLLGALPFEIHRMILSQAPTFDALRALVHASPQLHRVYVQDRLPILRGFVERTFDGFLVDAHFAHETGTDEFQHTRSELPLSEKLHDYVQRLAVRSDWLGGWPDLAKNMSLEDIMPLIHFHRSVIEPLTERYATWALAALSSGSYPQSHPLAPIPNPTLSVALRGRGFPVRCIASKSLATCLVSEERDGVHRFISQPLSRILIT